MTALHSSTAAPALDSAAPYTADNAYGNFEVTINHAQLVMPNDRNLRGDFYCQIKCGEQVYRTGSIDISRLIKGQQVLPVGAGALVLTLPFEYSCSVPAPSLNSSCVITVFSVFAGSTSTMAWLQTPSLSSLFDVVKPPPPKKEEQVGKQQWTAQPQDLAQSAVRARLTRKKSTVSDASAPSSPSSTAAAVPVEESQEDTAADTIELPEGWRRLNESTVAARASLTGRSGSVREGWMLNLKIEEDSVKRSMRSGGIPFTECPWHCGCVVIAGHMEQHLSWCRLAPDPATAISCSNATVGCSFTGLRPAVAEHQLTCQYTALATVFAQFAQERDGVRAAIKAMEEEAQRLQHEKLVLKQTVFSAVQAQRAGIPYMITPALECDVGLPGQTMHEFLQSRALQRLRRERSAPKSPSSTNEGDDNRLEATQIHGSTAAHGRTSMRAAAIDEALLSSNGKAFKTTSAGSHFGFDSAEEARRPSVEPPEGSSSSLSHWLPTKRVGKLHAHDAGVFCISVAVLGGDSGDVGSFHPVHDHDDNVSLRGQTLMFTGGGDGVVKVWNDVNATPALQRSLTGHTLSVRCIAAMAATAYSGSQDCSIRVWDVERGVSSGTLLGHTGTVMSLIAYGDLCVSMGADRSMRLWDVRQQRCTQVFDTGSRGNYGMSVYKGSVVSAQGSILFEADIRTMRTQRWQAHAAVTAVNVSAAVGTAASGLGAAALSSAIERVKQHVKEDSGTRLPSDDYSAAHEQAQTLSAGVGPIGYYTSISSNVTGCGGQILRGDTLYAGNVDCSISLWNMPLHCDIKQAALKGHTDYVRDLQSFGAHLFSVSDDGCVKCWDPVKLLSAVRTLAPSAFQKAEEELAAEEAQGGDRLKYSDGADDAPLENSKVFTRAPSEVQDYNLRAKRAKEAAKIALSTVSVRVFCARLCASSGNAVCSCICLMPFAHAFLLQVRNGITQFDVSSLLQRMRLHEGHSISSCALARSIDNAHDGHFLCVAEIFTHP